jgi:hypothetical protein
MKTDDLIAALVADNGRRVMPFAQRLVLAVLAGLCIAAVIYFAGLGGPRADLAQATASARFLLKVGIVLVLLATAARVAAEVIRPTWTPDLSTLVLLAAPVLVVAAVLGELVVVPPAEWWARLMGHNALLCLSFIPLLSLGPLAAVLFAMRSGAPSEPRSAGAVAGLVAGGVGATLYATHCVDDSPLFVATWYPIGIAVITLLGSAIGARVLKW